ncbi:hypothetical protein AaE_012439 [Aphanomyces astaci]|uniref:Protein kinase domain-containing protein n=1 Tax=Aphanomyces astaci TaxID=112090 RepID=A0A6A4ZFX4_APHAT|nr:hypothetical protein AaE_012439 [Aphanomyces astaci]
MWTVEGPSKSKVFIDHVKAPPVQDMPSSFSKQVMTSVAVHPDMLRLRAVYLQEHQLLVGEMTSLGQDVDRQRRDLDIEELYMDQVLQQPVTCSEHEQSVRDLQERLANKRRSHKAAKIRFLQLKRNVLLQHQSEFATLPCLNGTLQLRRLLGRGASSEVWQAHCLSTDSLVAVKLSANIQNATVEFDNHKLVTAHSSRYAVPVHTLAHTTFHQREYAIMTMDCMNCDLAHYLETNGPCAPLLARHILHQLALATTYMHENNMAHGDLKPGNVLVKDVSAVTVQLTDFHLARPRYDPIDVGVNASPSYAPPEWYLLPTTADSCEAGTTYEKADVWALGVIYYQSLFTRHPMGSFSSKHELQHNMRLYSSSHPTSTSSLHFPTAIPAMDMVILARCLHPDWTARPTAMELLAMLSQLT